MAVANEGDQRLCPSIELIGDLSKRGRDVGKINCADPVLRLVERGIATGSSGGP